jgi:hypothetical protein
MDSSSSDESAPGARRVPVLWNPVDVSYLGAQQLGLFGHA